MITCSNILMLDPPAGCMYGSPKQLYIGFLIAIHALILLATCMHGFLLICMLVIYLLQLNIDIIATVNTTASYNYNFSQLYYSYSYTHCIASQLQLTCTSVHTWIHLPMVPLISNFMLAITGLNVALHVSNKSCSSFPEFAKVF